MALLASPCRNQIVATHAVLGFEMADHGLDGRPAAQFTFDLGRHPSLLAGDEDLELVVGGRVVAAVSLVGEDARDGANLQLGKFPSSDLSRAEQGKGGPH